MQKTKKLIKPASELHMRGLLSLILLLFSPQPQVFRYNRLLDQGAHRETQKTQFLFMFYSSMIILPNSGATCVHVCGTRAGISDPGEHGYKWVPVKPQISNLKKGK